jgi:hypothetical protein
LTKSGHSTGASVSRSPIHQLLDQVVIYRCLNATIRDGRPFGFATKVSDTVLIRPKGFCHPSSNYSTCDQWIGAAALNPFHVSRSG